MNTSVVALSRDRSVWAGLVGMIVGALLVIGLVFALDTASRQGEGVAGIQSSGLVPVVTFESFLRDHVAREWAADYQASVMVRIAAALREHLAREYRSGGPDAPGSGASGLGGGPALRDHLLREYRSQ